MAEIEERRRLKKARQTITDVFWQFFNRLKEKRKEHWAARTV